MKKIICFLLLFRILISQAQTIKWGETNEFDKRNHNIVGLMGNYKDNFYLLMHRKESFFIQKYSSSSLKLIKEIATTLPYSYRIVDGNIYIFSSQSSSNGKETQLYFQIFDSDLKSIAKPEKIAEVRNTNKKKQGYFSILASEDKSKILILSENYIKEEENQKFVLNVFDDSMQKLWNRNIDLPYKDDLFWIENISIDNSGSVYLLGKKYNEKLREKRDGDVNYTHEVFVFNQDGSKMQKSISLGDKYFVTDITMKLNNNINLVGFYGERANKNLAKGVFSITIDKQNNIMQSNQKEFDEDFVKDFAKASMRKKGSQLYYYYLKQMLKQDDGSTLLFAECQYIEVEKTTDQNGRSYSSEIYHHEDILCIKMNKNNEIQDIKQIKKKQLTPDRYGIGSFTVHKYGNGSYVLFNDNIKNEDIISGKSGEPMKNKPALFVVKIENNGDMSKKLLYEKHQDKIDFNPYSSFQINDKEMLIIATSEKKYAIGIVTFD